jgi:DNA polymerase-3 subunit gamma/tau
MSFQVLARKWRPPTFDDMAGQEHVLRALINALDNDRLHHAYLFTGTRGVGKTTLARIFAKCLNCEEGVSSKPCDKCSACQAITEGRFIDLIEVDAASRTKVEDTRELLDNVQYLPTSGRYKIYLIDEVHMLSTHSFNALLKTLEEPPPHVKFLLATTDPQKLPVTVLSRCLQFNLKNLSPDCIVDYLKGVLAKEQVPFEEAAVWSIARAADGSMRDALSLTDQAIAHGDGKIVEADLNTMLGSISRSTVLALCQKVAKQDARAVLELVEELAEHAPDYAGALTEMLSIWHRVAVVQAVPGALDNSFGDREVVTQLAEALSREDVQLFYQICLLGSRDLPLAADPRSGLEMVLLRQVAFKPESDEGPAPSGSNPPERASAKVKTSQTTPAPTVPSAGTPDGEGGEKAKKKSEPRVEISATQTEKTTPVNGVAAVSGSTENVYAGQIKTPEEPAGGTDKVSMQEPNTVNNGTTDDAIAAGHAEDHPVEHGKPCRSSVKENVVMPTSEEEPTAESIENGRSNGGQDEEAFAGQPWAAACFDLKIDGRLLNIASNLAFVERTGKDFLFKLDQQHSSLYDQRHPELIARALGSYLDDAITVTIDIAPSSIETPSMCRQREQAERQAKAVQALHDDPLVQALEQRFGGTLEEETVIPLD